MERTSAHTLKTSTLTLAVLVVVTFFTGLYMKGLNSGIPYYYDSIGYSATVGGTFVAVFTLSSTVMRLVGGQITDHANHFKVLLVSLVVMFFGAAIPALVPGFAVAMASRVLQGASFAVATNVMTVAVMGSSSKRHLGKRLGIKGAGTSLGTMFGALVSTALLDSLGYEAFYWFYAILMAVAVAAVVWLQRARIARAEAGEADALPEPAAKGEDVPRTLKGRLRAFCAPFLLKDAAPFMAISFARRIPKGFCIAFILIFCRFSSIPMGAGFFVAAGATMIACRLFGGRLFDKDDTWLLLPLQSVEIVGFLAFAIVPSFWTLIAAAIGYGISVGTTSPMVKALAGKAVPEEHWGAVNGELFFFADIGKSLSAFLGGLLIDWLTKDAIPVLALATTIISSAITAASLLWGRRVWRVRP